MGHEIGVVNMEVRFQWVVNMEVRFRQVGDGMSVVGKEWMGEVVGCGIGPGLGVRVEGWR